MTNLILFGFKGSGKSFWGKRLAQEINYRFIDTDTVLEEHYFSAHQIPLKCPEIYKKMGDEAFRRMEREVIDSLKGSSKCVIALGGGAILFGPNRDILSKMGVLVYLKVEKEILRERFFLKGIPAFLETEHPERSFEKMIQDRLPIYESIPSKRLILAEKTDGEILQILKEFAHGK